MSFKVLDNLGQTSLEIVEPACRRADGRGLPVWLRIDPTPAPMRKAIRAR
jgi:hypothetical protein